MKTSSLRKVIIPSFSLLIGGSLAATISSTLAWFQYATRANIAYVGAVVHGSKLLKVSIDNGIHWGNEYYQNDTVGRIEGNYLLPITSGPMGRNDPLTYYTKDLGNNQTKSCVRFYGQPELGRSNDYNSWELASYANYAQFTILVKVNDVDGATSPALVNDVYITKLIIEDDSTNGTGSDLSDAVRVHLSITDATQTNKHMLFAKSVSQTVVGGKMDLNNDGKIDSDLDSFGEQDCIYGVENAMQYSYRIDDSNAVVQDPDNPAPGTNPISIGKTGTSLMKIVVTTWIEGWSLLDHGYTDNYYGEENAAVWDASFYVDKVFNVGIQLGIKSHDTDHQN